MVAISFQGVRKSFRQGLGRRPVLHGLDLEVRHGEIYGFIGPNGAGKSTSIKLLLNFLNPDQGRLFIAGREVGRRRFQELIGYLPETPCFYENLTGHETVCFAGRAAALNGAALRERGREVLASVDLATAASSRVRTYSKGMKQRLGLAVALVHDPDIYILDEPMSGLDPMGRHLVTNIIMDLKERKKTVFFSSHILNDVEVMCDRVGILHRGRLVFSGPMADLLRTGETLEDVFMRFVQDPGSA